MIASEVNPGTTLPLPLFGGQFWQTAVLWDQAGCGRMGQFPWLRPPVFSTLTILCLVDVLELVLLFCLFVPSPHLLSTCWPRSQLTSLAIPVCPGSVRDNGHSNSLQQRAGCVTGKQPATPASYSQLCSPAPAKYQNTNNRTVNSQGIPAAEFHYSNVSYRPSLLT